MQDRQDSYLHSSNATLPADRPAPWVPPMETMTVLPVSEVTQNFSNPGDDGAGIFTGS